MARRPRLPLFLLAILCARPASAEVRSLRLQIRLNCPYGLAG